MLRAAIAIGVIVVVLAVGSALIRPKPSSTSDAPSSSTQQHADDRQSVTMAADGDGNSAQFHLEGDYAVSWQTTGDCSYYADLEGASHEGLFSASAAATGDGFVYSMPAGNYYVQMITGPVPRCPWTVTLTPTY